MCELPTTTTSPMMIGRAAVRDLAVRRIDADGAISADALVLVPRLTRLGLARRRRVTDHERTGIVHRERHDRQVKTFLEVDDAVLADLGIAFAGLRVKNRQVVAGRYHDDALGAASIGPVRQPRPANWRGAFCQRMVSSFFQVHTVLPVAGSIA